VQLTAIETGYPGFDAFRIGKRPEIDYHAWSEAIGVEMARFIRGPSRAERDTGVQAGSYPGCRRLAAEPTDELYRLR
jgi:hypothetical protein